MQATDRIGQDLPFPGVFCARSVQVQKLPDKPKILFMVTDQPPQNLPVSIEGLNTSLSDRNEP